MIAHTTNPTKGGSYEKGKSNNQGTVIDLQTVTNPSNGEKRLVTDNISPNNSEFILEVPTTCEELPTGSVPNKNGPIEGTHTSRPKWTRLIQMERGPGNSKQSERKEILVKRASSPINTEEAGDDVEVHVEKRGRVQDDQFIIEAAGVPEHP